MELQEWSDIDITETTASINKTSNWKAPGIDGVANFWVKNFPSVHEDLTHAYNSVVKNPEECPDLAQTGNHIPSCAWHNVVAALYCVWQNVVKPMECALA